MKYSKIFSVTKKVKIKKVSCIIYGNYKKFKNPKILQIFEKTLVVSIVYIRCDDEDEKIFR